jgi:hypothetical protein
MPSSSKTKAFTSRVAIRSFFGEGSFWARPSPQIRMDVTHRIRKAGAIYFRLIRNYGFGEVAEE